MPDFVTCPACGVRVQTAEVLFGQRVRCFACDHRFVAAADPPAAALPEPARRVAPPRRPVEEEDDREPLPYCPGCGRQIPWEVLRCPFCDEELEPTTNYQRTRSPWPPRRLDCLPHRGRFLLTLGNLSLAIGGLSVCTLGFGALVSVPLGIATWVLANNDLAEMRAGRIDPQGRSATENGRTGAVMGIVLGLLFGIFYAIVYLANK
jgi:hypothetical protein